MALFQEILVYVILFTAIAYIVKKFFLPKSLFASKKDVSKICGDNDCGCH
jgi:hypothetical protein